ncbi:MAG: hypothetical protein K0R25_1359 [Rickettsiaceae bacterium]|jgi:hypothetical protein|nr:hypothetical protein [Rickettsiaceae bacterium]
MHSPAPQNKNTAVTVTASSSPTPISLIPHYKEKISGLKKRIITAICFVLASIAAIIAIIAYHNISSQFYQNQLSDFTTQVEDLKNKVSNIETRLREVQKYKQFWIDADNKKKDFLREIKISEVRDVFDSMAAKYGINPSITISPPEVLQNGVYKGRVLETNVVNCTISLETPTDTIAANFIDEFLTTFTGYTIINDISVKKSKKEYTEEDLINISMGKNTGSVSTKVSFSWYFLKYKTKNTPADEKAGK